MKNLYLLIAILSLFATNAMAQMETANWTFGNRAGLSWLPSNLRSFNATGINGTPNARLDNLPGAFTTNGSNLEGVFSMSDKDGNLLFYSNGMNIWKADGTQIYSLLGGDNSSAQSGIVVPYPGDESRFICVGIGQRHANNMGYVIVKANSPTDVTIEGNRIAFSGHTGLLGESMSAVRHANGRDWWIVAPGKGNPLYLNAWLVTPAGVQAAVPAQITQTSINIVADSSNGYLKFTPDAKHFVWGTWGGNVLIYGDFNNSTGAFSNIRFINSHAAYGVEFSPSQKYLYTSITNYNGGIPSWHIWDFENFVNGLALTHIKEITGFSYPGALQQDPTGRIWGVDNSQRDFMFVIDNPDDPVNLRTYRLENFLATGIQACLGLPSFAATFFSLAIQGPTELCMDSEQEFSLKIIQGTGSDELSHTEWDFGDGKPDSVVTDNNVDSGQQTRNYTYTKTGKYTVTVKVFLKSDGSEVTGQRQILDVNVNPCVMPVNPNIHLH